MGQSPHNAILGSEKGGMDRIGGSLSRFRPFFVPSLSLVWTQRELPDPKIAPLVAQHNQLMHLTHLNLTSPKPSLGNPITSSYSSPVWPQLLVASLSTNIICQNASCFINCPALSVSPWVHWAKSSSRATISIHSTTCACPAFLFLSHNPSRTLPHHTTTCRSAWGN